MSRRLTLSRAERDALRSMLLAGTPPSDIAYGRRGRTLARFVKVDALAQGAPVSAAGRRGRA